MMGGLHLEMALWKTLGDVLEDFGWTTALTEAEVASSGTALFPKGYTPHSN